MSKNQNNKSNKTRKILLGILIPLAALGITAGITVPLVLQCQPKHDKVNPDLTKITDKNLGTITCNCYLNTDSTIVFNPNKGYQLDSSSVKIYINDELLSVNNSQNYKIETNKITIFAQAMKSSKISIEAKSLEIATGISVTAPTKTFKVGDTMTQNDVSVYLLKGSSTKEKLSWNRTSGYKIYYTLGKAKTEITNFGSSGFTFSTDGQISFVIDYSQNSSFQKSFNLNVEPSEPIAPTSIEIVGPTTIYTGYENNYSVTVSPASAVKNVTWSVINSSSATAIIDEQTGCLMGTWIKYTEYGASGTGTVQLKATSTLDPSVSKTITITVKNYSLDDISTAMDTFQNNYLYSIDSLNNISAAGTINNKEITSSLFEYNDKEEATGTFNTADNTQTTIQLGGFSAYQISDYIFNFLDSKIEEKYGQFNLIAKIEPTYVSFRISYIVDPTQYEEISFNKDGYITKLVNTFDSKYGYKYTGVNITSISYSNVSHSITQSEFETEYNSYLSEYEHYKNSYSFVKLSAGSLYAGKSCSSADVFYSDAYSMTVAKLNTSPLQYISVAGDTTLIQYINNFSDELYTKTFTKDAQGIIYKIVLNSDPTQYEEVKYDKGSYILYWKTTIKSSTWNNTDLKGLTFGPTVVDFNEIYTKNLKNNFPLVKNKYKRVTFKTGSHYKDMPLTEGPLTVEQDKYIVDLGEDPEHPGYRLTYAIGGQPFSVFIENLKQDWGSYYKYFTVSDTDISYKLIYKPDPSYYTYIKFNKDCMILELDNTLFDNNMKYEVDQYLEE